MSSKGRNIWGETKGEIMDLGGAKPTLDGGKRPSKCKWFNLLIFANLCLL